MVCLALGALTPGVVYAEGDVPEAPPPEAALPEEPEPEEAASAVEALAESGSVIVQEGAPLPLASQAALEVLCEPDPWFYCSKPGPECVMGRSTNFPNFTTAILKWVPLRGYGFMYLTGGGDDPYAGEDINVAALPGLKGIVWDTTGGTKPVINSRLYVHDYTLGFTLQGITLSGSSTADLLVFDGKGILRLTDVEVTNLAGSGIAVVNRGPLILNRVSSSRNGGGGAWLYTAVYNGSTWVPYGGVTITSSSFNGNGTDENTIGLTVIAGGSTLLNGVSAVGNIGDGAQIGTYGLYPIVIKNSVFSRNIDAPDVDGRGLGLAIVSNAGGSITLENVRLDGNDEAGAYLAATTGNITLKKVTAGYNGRNGVFISGEYDGYTPGAKAVTVSDSIFYKNESNNLCINASGAVRITNLQSTDSHLNSGLQVYNFYVSPQPVTILGANLSNNSNYGGYIQSYGTITVAGINASDNGYGLSLTNSGSTATGNVVVLGSLGINRFNGNIDNYGLRVSSNRNISLNSIQANGNQGSGIWAFGEGITSNVTLVNVEATGSIGDGTRGVSVVTKGNVLLDRVTTAGNASEGIYIDNDDPSTSLLARTVTIRNSTASGNGLYGINVSSIGAITLSNIVAGGNVDDGAILYNHILASPTLLPPGITVVKGTFNDNDSFGLYLESQGKVTVTSITASGNTSGGAYLNNAFSTVGRIVLISGVNKITANSIGTGYPGLYVVSNGPVSISGVTAAWNHYIGIYIFTPAAVTITSSQVSDSGSYGLMISNLTLPSGPVTLSGVSLIANGFEDDAPGALITSNAKVTFIGGYYIGNAGAGIYLNLVGPLGTYSIAPSVVLFGNDARGPYNDDNLEVVPIL